MTIDLATHDADILSWIAGERPSRVYGETSQRIHATNEDLLFGLLNFPSGALGMIDVNWLTPAKRRQLAVVGEEGMFELDYLTQRLTFTRATDTTNPRLIGGYAPTFEGNPWRSPSTRPSPLPPSSTHSCGRPDWQPAGRRRRGRQWARGDRLVPACAAADGARST